MRLYFDFEHDEFLTEENLKEFYNLMTEEEKKEYENNVEHYIECCLLKNNGCCYTLEEYENRIKKELSMIQVNEYEIDDLYNHVCILKELYEFKEKHNR